MRIPLPVLLLFLLLGSGPLTGCFNNDGIQDDGSWISNRLLMRVPALPEAWQRVSDESGIMIRWKHQDGSSMSVHQEFIDESVDLGVYVLAAKQKTGDHLPEVLSSNPTPASVGGKPALRLARRLATGNASWHQQQDFIRTKDSVIIVTISWPNDSAQGDVIQAARDSIQFALE